MYIRLECEFHAKITFIEDRYKDSIKRYGEKNKIYEYV